MCQSMHFTSTMSLLLFNTNPICYFSHIYFNAWRLLTNNAAPINPYLYLCYLKILNVPKTSRIINL